MTAALDQEFTETARPATPRGLKPGTLVYLWPPGEGEPGNRPILAKVERATSHSIVASDLTNRARGSYEVGDSYAPGLRWTWDVAAPPQGADLADGVTFVDRQQLNREERRQWLLGDVGATLVFYLQGGAQVAGVVTEIAYDADNPIWLIVEPPADGTAIKPFRARVCMSQIVKIMEVTGG